MQDKFIWVEKYRPQSLTEYGFQSSEDETIFKDWIAKGEMPHLLLHGSPGIGKTSLVNVLLNELKIDRYDYLIINASEENSVDTIREKVKQFIDSTSFGKFKVVVLEEGDYITHSGQAALKRIIEEYSDTTRFVITCNDITKIHDAIKSRLIKFEFINPDRNDLVELLAKILIAEHVTFNVKDLDSVVSMFYPDRREMINFCQQKVVGSKLIIDDLSSTTILGQAMTMFQTQLWPDLISHCTRTFNQGHWARFYTQLYNNLETCPKFKNKDKWQEAVLTIADYLYKSAYMTNQTINGVAMLIKLASI